MYYLKQLPLFILLFDLACTQSKSKDLVVIKATTDTVPLPQYKPKAGVSYLQCKIKVAQQRTLLQKATVDSLSNAFTTLLLEELIPYWYGTPWSFDGHPEQPGTKPVACSYFVSTVLRDAGVQVNRYTLAQQLPELEAKTLAQPNDCLVYENQNSEATLRSMQETLPEGIHFIGFDKIHVGFVVKQDNRLYFIHSYYKNNCGVIMEVAHQSDVPDMCDRFYVTPLSGNAVFLSKWLYGKPLKVLKQ